VIGQQFTTDIDSCDGRMNGTAGHEGYDVAEAVAGIDNQGCFLLRIFNLVFVTAEISRVGPTNIN